MFRLSSADSQLGVLLSGILLASSFLILLAALVVLIASGAVSAFSAVLQGPLSGWAPFAATFRSLNLLWVIAWVIQLLGFALLAYELHKAGEGLIAITAFTAVLLAAILGILHGTFHMSVETWAAEEAARTGSVPPAFEPIDIWVSAFFRVAYMLHLAATAVFGWGIIRGTNLPAWVGQMAIGWGLLWLSGLTFGAGLPGILFLMPAVIGVFLIRGSIQLRGDKIK